MLRIFSFAAILALLSCCSALVPGSATHDCQVSGQWMNARNSTLHLKASDGRLGGQYVSAVGNAAGVYPVSGSYELEGCTTGFCVTWSNAQHGNSQSTTCWVGEVRGDTLNTMYTLVYSVPSEKDAWRQYLTNVDFFKRV